jgi:hypothetical protein
MEALQEELSSIGTVSSTAFVRNATDGSRSQYTFAEEVSNVVADPAQCQLSYHWREWQGRAAQPFADSDYSFYLRNVWSVDFQSASGELTTQMVAEGNPSLVVTSTAPPVTLIVLLLRGGAGELPFTDAGLANRAANALTQAVRLCGGHLAN